jgi:hypothetical protein
MKSDVLWLHDGDKNMLEIIAAIRVSRDRRINSRCPGSWPDITCGAFRER